MQRETEVRVSPPLWSQTSGLQTSRRQSAPALSLQLEGVGPGHPGSEHRVHVWAWEGQRQASRPRLLAPCELWFSRTAPGLLSLERRVC